MHFDMRIIAVAAIVAAIAVFAYRLWAPEFADGEPAPAAAKPENQSLPDAAPQPAP